MIHRAFIGIGSNLDDPQTNVRAAIAALASIGKIARASSLYRTKPWGVTEQPDFINAVVLLKTSLPPRMLLSALKSIEGDLGRTPGERWGPRIIDLDILIKEFAHRGKIDEQLLDIFVTKKIYEVTRS